MCDHTTNKQFVDLSLVNFKGNILDVGGGGEGIISRHSKNSVISIDWRKDELEETAEIGLKIVMDACNMTFLDRMFDNITSFYTLMYMDLENAKSFLKEAYRALKPNGLLWIWDTIIPSLSKNDIFIVPLEVKISVSESVSTGYGIGWSRAQTPSILREIITDVGFSIENYMVHENRFELCCRRN